MNNKRVAIIIPAYNEEKTILQVVDDFRSAAPTAAIYVINNNSKDRTAEFVESAKKEDPNLFLLHENQQGKSEAMRFAFLHNPIFRLLLSLAPC